MKKYFKNTTHQFSDTPLMGLINLIFMIISLRWGISYQQLLTSYLTFILTSLLFFSLIAKGFIDYMSLCSIIA